MENPFTNPGSEAPKDQPSVPEEGETNSEKLVSLNPEDQARIDRLSDTLEALNRNFEALIGTVRSSREAADLAAGAAHEIKRTTDILGGISHSIKDTAGIIERSIRRV